MGDSTKWIVYGECGQYSDWHLWVVAVHDTEASALAHVDRLRPLANDATRLYGWMDKYNDPEKMARWKAAIAAIEAADPNVEDHFFFDVVHYDVSETPWIRSLP